MQRRISQPAKRRIFNKNMIIATATALLWNEETNKLKKLKNEPAEKNVYRLKKETGFSDL